MSLNTKSGKQKVTPQKFMDIQNSLQPDFFECLSIDVPYHITSKKIKKSVDITLSWLDQCIKFQDKVKVEIKFLVLLNLLRIIRIHLFLELYREEVTSINVFDQPQKLPREMFQDSF